MFYDGLVDELESIGAPDDIVSKVARLVYLAERNFSTASSREKELSADKLEKRREKDRERKRKSYAETKAKKLNSNENAVAPSAGSRRGRPRKSPNISAEKSGQFALFLSSEEPKKNELVVRKERVKEGQQVRTEYVEKRAPKTSGKGTRIPADFRPPPAVIEWCRVEYQLEGKRLEDEISDFVDFWTSATRNACKSRWDLTFKNRIRELARRTNGFKRTSVPTVKNAASFLDAEIAKADQRERAKAEDAKRTIDLEPGDYAFAGFALR